MSKKISIKGVSPKSHDYLRSSVTRMNVNNQGEAFDTLISNDKSFNELGLNDSKVSKMKIVEQLRGQAATK